MCSKQDVNACVLQTSGYDADSDGIAAAADHSADCDDDGDCDDDADCFSCKT